MPYKKVKGHSECDRGQIAVVSPSGKVAGCHDSEEDANEQIAALMAKEQEKSSRWVDRFTAAKVLSGEPVLLLPVMPGGYFRWGAQRDPITENVLLQMLGNFEQGAQIGGLVSRPPLNIEHDEGGGKIGSIVKLELGEGGLYAVFDLTERGTKLLEDGGFDYLSPEIVWEFEDIKTGTEVGPVIVGAAVTNYPFFGEATAMYSDRAAEKIVESFAMRPGDDDHVVEAFDRIMDAYKLVEDLGFRHSDFDDWLDEPVRVLAKVAEIHGLERRRQILAALSLCEAQRESDGLYYPRSAYLETGDGRWRYRVKGYDEETYSLQYDGRLVRQAREDMTANEPELLSRYPALFEWFITNNETQEGAVMPDNQTNEGQVSVEQFQALQSRTDTFAAQVDALTAQVAERDARLEEMRTERTIERYSREAESFAALGVEVSEYASHLAWLESADPEGEHLAWFRAVLAAADESLSQSDAFRSVGTNEQAPGGSDPFARIQSLMAVKAKERGVGLQVGTSTYNEIMTEVMRENPELMEQYRSGIISGGSEPPSD